MDLIPKYSLANFEELKTRLQIHLSTLHSRMWDVVENKHIRIEKINTAPPTARSVRSNEEHMEEQVEEEEAATPRSTKEVSTPKTTIVPKPYNEWTKEDHILYKLDITPRMRS